MKGFNLLIILLLLSFIRCATVGQPSGGDLDEIPPKLVTALPDSFVTQFKGHRLIYTFDEYFVLEKANQSVLISPPLRKAPEFTIKRKTLVVDFPEELKPNTTYQINFSESIRDLNEGNILQDFKMVFSTGEKIDSLRIGAVVRDAYTKAPMEGMSLMLFPDTLDSALLSALPYYFARTGASGEADLTFLPPGQYFLYALEDKNGNYVLDRNEQVGFLDSTINLPADSARGVEIVTFLPAVDSLLLLKQRRRDEGHYQLYFNLPVDSVAIRPYEERGDSGYQFLGYGVERDTVDWFYYPAPEEDSGRYVVNINGVDTIIKFTGIKARRGAGAQNKGLLISLSAQNGQLDLGTTLVLISNIPIQQIDPDSLTLLEDSISLSFTINTQNEVRTQFKIEADFKPGKKYTLIVPRGIIKAVSGESNDSLEFSFHIPLEEEYGNILTNIRLVDSQAVLIQLVQEKGGVVREQQINTSGIVSFKLVKPGTYKLQAVIDANGNGKWDTGSFKERRQPEKVMILNPDLNVRANWDILDLNYIIDLNAQRAP